MDGVHAENRDRDMEATNSSAMRKTITDERFQYLMQRL